MSTELCFISAIIDVVFKINEDANQKSEAMFEGFRANFIKYEAEIRKNEAMFSENVAEIGNFEAKNPVYEAETKENESKNCSNALNSA